MRDLPKLRLSIVLNSKTYSRAISMQHGSVLQDLNQHTNFRTVYQLNNNKYNVHNNHYEVKQFCTTSLLLKSKDRGKDKKKSRPEHVDLKELALAIDIDKLMTQYERVLDTYKDHMIKYLAVRSSIGAVEQLPIKFDGDEYMLQELVQISRKPNLLVLNASAFPQSIPDIMEVLAKSQMNLNPQQDGTTIYIPIPKVTKEHRENLAKTAKTYFNKCKDDIRDVRNKNIKKIKDNSELASDLVSRLEGYIDVLSNQYSDKAENMLRIKQKELLGDPDK